MPDCEPMLGIDVGPAGAGDIADVARLHAADFAPGWPEAQWRGYLARTAERPSATGSLYVARQAATITSIGFLLARRVTDEAEILAIGVTPTWRRHGIARALIAHLEADLRRDLPCRLFLEVSTDNAAAHALYEGEGFIEVGTRKRYYRRAGRAPVDARILARDLVP